MNGQKSSTEERETLVEAALRILNTPDPFEKAKLGETIALRWIQGSISLPFNQYLDLEVPDRPARLSTVKLVPPSLMPKLGKAGSLRSRQAILHSLVHTESWAIDLSWDIIARFGKQESLPREFFTDFVKVAQDEGRHFTILVARLEELGSFYGAFPAHDGLWDSAMATSRDLLARLAVEHCVHEARGLDVLPTTITRFRNGGDNTTADLLETVVYPEEITHCAAGVKWFKYICLRRARSRLLCVESDSSKIREEDVVESELEHAKNVDQKTLSCLSDEHHDDDEDMVVQLFHDTVRSFFSGPLKPPFNEKARKDAGFGPQWYEPLAVKEP